MWCEDSARGSTFTLMCSHCTRNFSAHFHTVNTAPPHSVSGDGVAERLHIKCCGINLGYSRLEKWENKAKLEGAEREKPQTE